MKKLLTILAGALMSCLLLDAQQYNVLDIVKADARKAYGMEGPHRLDENSPRNMKPFTRSPLSIPETWFRWAMTSIWP